MCKAQNTHNRLQKGYQLSAALPGKGETRLNITEKILAFGIPAIPLSSKRGGMLPQS